MSLVPRTLVSHNGGASRVGVAEVAYLALSVNASSSLLLFIRWITGRRRPLPASVWEGETRGGKAKRVLCAVVVVMVRRGDGGYGGEES